MTSSSKPIMLLFDGWDFLKSLPTGDFEEIGKEARSLLLQIFIPNYGFYGGPGVGTDHLGIGLNIVPLNRIDWASYWHDRHMTLHDPAGWEFFEMGEAHAQWIDNTINYQHPCHDVLPPGPFGLLYQAFGIPAFSLFSVADTGMTQGNISNNQSYPNPPLVAQNDMLHYFENLKPTS